MRVLVIGGGGREHALVWKIRQSPLVEHVFCAPGNAGIEKHAECIPVVASDLDGLLGFARRERIDLTIVGPEEPLVKGIVDRFRNEGLPIFGVSARAARLEGSKAFAKGLMERHGIPTGFARAFSDSETAKDYLREIGAPVVVKADGLAAGKGVFPCTSLNEAYEAVNSIMVQRTFGDAGNQVVVEEYLEGEEASFLAFTDGKTVIPFPSSQDHKAIFDDDKGPNTGGMGAYSPAPIVTPEVHEQVMERIMIPTVRAMAEEDSPYMGVLYAGLMISNGVAKVLEFNARFGDPEAQPLLMRFKGDLVEVFLAVIEGRLHEVDMDWTPGATVCVVMASEGYPGTYERGKSISGLEMVENMEGVVVFHAGTARKGEDIVTAGGRVLGVTAMGSRVEEAIQRAYSAAEKIHWEGAYFRADIGKKALNRNGR
jgi:phosphoribosylamine--glycine ligase